MKTKCKVINGKYSGREGYIIDNPNFGFIMFYSKEGIYPYRVCLPYKDLEVIE